MAIRTESNYPWTIKKLIELIGTDIEATKIFLDLSFQSIFRWDKAKQEKFLRCTMEGFATSPIVFASVAKCLDKAKDRGDSESIQYFEKVKKDGFEYIIIDGNNRMTTLADFFNDKIGLPIGTYTNLYNPSLKYTVTGDKGQHAVKFSKLSSTLQDYLKVFLLNTTIVESITRRELSLYFDALNDGVSLNIQEKRNSWFSEMAEIVRKAGDEFSDTFGRLISGNFDVKRRSNDLLIAHLITMCQSEPFSVEPTPKLVNMAYGKNIDYHSSTASNSEDALRYLKKSMDVVEHFQGKDLPKTIFVDIFNIMRQHDHLFIKDNEAYAKYLMEVIVFCRDDDKDILLTDKTGSFPYAGILRQTYTPKYMKLRMEKLMKTFWTLDHELAESLMSTSEEAQGIVKDKQRIFTPSQRYKIWKKQGEKEPRSRIEIPLCDINDTSKWQADHIVEWNEGGRTTVENGELLSVSAHTEKTSSYNRKRQLENIAEKRAAMAGVV